MSSVRVYLVYTFICCDRVASSATPCGSNGSSRRAQYPPSQIPPPPVAALDVPREPSRHQAFAGKFKEQDGRHGRLHEHVQQDGL